MNYTPKAARGEIPKMLLVADIASDDENVVAAAASHVVHLANARNAEGFIAVSDEARRRFWQDRSRTAAIAAHTNAFKINEDVVIPLDKLADYSAEIERINIEQSIANKITLLEEIQKNLIKKQDDFKLLDSDPESEKIFSARFLDAAEKIDAVKSRWNQLLNNLDDTVDQHQSILLCEEKEKVILSEKILAALMRHEIVVSYRAEVERPLKQIFSGHDLQLVSEKLDELHQQVS